MLTQNGSKFTKCGKSVVTETNMTTRWRCTFKNNDRYACKAKAYTFMTVDGIETVKFLGTHCHAH